jgi:hypothetical protein
MSECRGSAFHSRIASPSPNYLWSLRRLEGWRLHSVLLESTDPVSLFLPHGAHHTTSLTSPIYALRPKWQFARNTLVSHPRIHVPGQGIQSVNGSRSDALPQAIRRYSGSPSHPIPAKSISIINPLAAETRTYCLSCAKWVEGTGSILYASAEGVLIGLNPLVAGTGNHALPWSACTLGHRAR